MDFFSGSVPLTCFTRHFQRVLRILVEICCNRVLYEQESLLGALCGSAYTMFGLEEEAVDNANLGMKEVSGIRWGWLRFMYLYTILGAGGFGLATLAIPEWMKTVFRWPGQEPIALSIVGSVYLAFGILSLFGLRDPLKFVPVLFLQLCYKLVWFVGAVAPLLAAGRFPGYAVPTAAIFATYIIGDLIAIPFSYVFTS